LRQHTTCFVIDDRVAIDAGTLAHAATDEMRSKLRDVVLTHAHLDHIAGLPLFVDDLFASLDGPIRVHASAEVIEVLERDVFNWSVYPCFSELTNDHGKVLEYVPMIANESASVAHLEITPIHVNHKVPTAGFVISDGDRTIAMTGDTAEVGEFWDKVNELERLDALLIECAFPDEMAELAEVSHHLTPRLLEQELNKFCNADCPIYVINIKPTYREQVIRELEQLNIPNLKVLEVGKTYEW
jgi:cAMP phosphodiesterase